jgi:hypothetical protein
MMFPSTKAQPVIDGVTIPGHYRKRIRTAAASPKFWAQCCKIQGWSEATLELINKPLLRQGVHSHCHKPQFVVKWLHHLLPTQEIKSSWEYCTSQCPRCDQIDDQHHLLRCTTAPVAAWRSTFFTAIQQWMEACDINYELMSVIIDALSAWLQLTTIPTDSAPFQCRPAMHEQNYIGRDSFVRGFWSTQWAIIQHDDYKCKKRVDNNTLGQIWAHLLLTVLWTHIGMAWTLHSDHIHRKDVAHQDTDLCNQLMCRINHLHDKHSTVLVIHRDAYFMTDIDDTLTNTKSLTVLRNWLQMYKPAILDSIALATDVALHHMKFLTQYFTVLKQSSRKPKPSYNKHTYQRQDPSRWKRRKKHLRSIRSELRPSSLPTPRPPALPPLTLLGKPLTELTTWCNASQMIIPISN